MTILDVNHKVFKHDLLTKSNIEIAKEYNVHRSTVWAWRKYFSIPRFIPKEVCQSIILNTIEHNYRNGNKGVQLQEMLYACKISRQKLYKILKELESDGCIYPIGKTRNRRWYLHHE